MSSRILDPYPAVYRFIFGYLEPLGLIAGAVFAITAPSSFHDAYLGRHHFTGDAHWHSHASQKSVMVASGMGSCMLIIGTISFFLLPALDKHLRGKRDGTQPQPALHEKILKTYLSCLLVGDFVHIAVTLFYAPGDVRWHPLSRWTILIWGNVIGTLMPNLARLAWFAGIGRKKIPALRI